MNSSSQRLCRFPRKLRKAPFLASLFVVILIYALGDVAAAQTIPALTIEHADGGPITTPLGYGIAVDKGSSLHRDWITVNDPLCPIQVSGGIQTTFGSDRYSYRLSEHGKASQAVAAIELISVLFDAWGNHMRNLQFTEVTDRASGESITFPQDSWYAIEADVGSYLSSVTYVRYVRTSDGKIWSANVAAIAKKLAEIQLKISEQTLQSVTPPPSPSGR